MNGIIHNIIALYEMHARALGVLVANTQRALDAGERGPEAESNEEGPSLQRVAGPLKVAETDHVNPMV